MAPLLHRAAITTTTTTTTTTTIFDHYTGQPALAGTPVKYRRTVLEHSFTARMPLLTAASALGLGRRR